MPKDTITLALNGEVSIQKFADAVSNLESLILALSKEINPNNSIKWIVHDLEISSAITTFRGESEIMDLVEKVVDAYGDVGESLQYGRRPEYTDHVIRPAQNITNLLDTDITSIRFETADVDAIIQTSPIIIEKPKVIKSIGAIEGRVQTLSNRKGLRFTLFDTLHDKAISCYLKEGQEELMREAWGKRVLIHGEISRDSETGRPFAVREVNAVSIIPEASPNSYLKARGIVPLKQGAEMPEVIIRKYRNAN